jgi:LCP family protein required for cell wall assembly
MNPQLFLTLYVMIHEPTRKQKQISTTKKEAQTHMFNKLSMLKKLKWIILSLSLLLLAGIGYYTYAFMSFANNIQAKPNVANTTKPSSYMTTQNVSTKVETYEPPKWEGKQRVNLLILGGDSRGLSQNEVPRSDSLIVASIDPVTKKAHLFSIMRDTYVKIPGHGEDRINAAYALGGPNLTMKTVSDLLGIPIQYYVYTDFKGFIALVDAIDGIEMDVEKDMKYSDSEDGPEFDINLKKGLQHLDGKTALQYVRFRHDALSDFSRTERQRNFIQIVVKKMQTTSSLLKLPWILSSIDPYIETNLSTTDMIKLGSLGYEAKTEGMTSQQIPPFELLQEKKVGGADVIGVNREKLQAFIRAMLETPDANSSNPNEVNNNTDNGAGTSNGNGASSRTVNQPASSLGETSKPAATSNKPASAPKSAATTVSPPATKKPATSSTSVTSSKPPAAGNTADSAAKPVTGSGGANASSAAGKPATGSATDPAAKPVIGSGAGNVSGAAGKPAAGSVTDSTAKPTASSATDSAAKPVTGSGAGNVPGTAGKPAAGTAADSTAKPAAGTTSGLMLQPATEATTDPAGKPASTAKPVEPAAADGTSKTGSGKPTTGSTTTTGSTSKPASNPATNAGTAAGKQASTPATNVDPSTDRSTGALVKPASEASLSSTTTGAK